MVKRKSWMEEGITTCDWCGSTHRVFVNHFEDHINERLNICSGCHNWLHMGIAEAEAGLVEPCRNPNCLYCKLGEKEFFRQIAAKVLADLGQVH